ncbi:MAG TPA: exodeoxyribonuclease VII small subunit [Candidatus Thermoplasmatota archaeon]|nr:exodeoxyribonuclease VII small subunit [Candidatus Thermoplasmatota archaeon]
MAEKKGREAAGDEAEELSFEAALKRLEEVVADLEGGRLALEDSLARFEEGMRLSKLCQEKLKGVELKIEKLVAEGGRTVPRPLDEDD